MRLNPRRLAGSIAAIAAVLLVALIASEPVPPSIDIVILFGCLLIVSEWLPVSLGLAEVTMSLPLLLAIAWLLPAGWAMAVAVLAAGNPKDLAHPRPVLTKTLFNRSQTGIATAAAALAGDFIRVSSRDLPLVTGEFLVLAIVYITVNTSLVSLMVSASHRIRFAEALRIIVPDSLAGHVISAILLVLLAAATAVAYTTANLGSFAVIAVYVPLLFARMSVVAARSQLEAMDPRPSPIEDVLRQPEGEHLEFKAGFGSDASNPHRSSTPAPRIIQTVSAFLNTGGGTVVVGVDDEGGIVGIEDDVDTRDERARDLWEQKLRNSMSARLGSHTSQYVFVTFEERSGKTICLIKATPASHPVFFSSSGRSDLFIRDGNTTRKLDARETYEYIRTHFSRRHLSRNWR